jgi:hypothetical protein
MGEIRHADFHAFHADGGDDEPKSAFLGGEVVSSPLIMDQFIRSSMHRGHFVTGSGSPLCVNGWLPRPPSFFSAQTRLLRED